MTLSTKAWEGDYRSLLEPAVWAQLWEPWGPATRRQLVLNRIADHGHADELAGELVQQGLLDDVIWAEDQWPRLARQLGVPESWFGAAWAFSVPELTELQACRTPVIAHQAGDVRLAAGSAWLPRALTALSSDPLTALVSPVSPSAIELVRPEARGASSGWVRNFDCSDQCFVGRPSELLTRLFVRCSASTGVITPSTSFVFAASFVPTAVNAARFSAVNNSVTV